MFALPPAQVVRLALLLTIAALATSLAGPSEAPAGVRVDTHERRVAKLINVHRARHGRPSLRLHRGLTRAATAHARAMARHGFVSHYSRDGTPFDVRVRRFARPRAVGEVLARLPAAAVTPRGVVVAWLRSPPHRAVLLSRGLRRIGLARVATSTESVYAADLGAGLRR